MARRTGKFESVNGILPELFRSLGLKKQYSGHMISFYWDRIVGPDIARHIRPVRVSFQTLFLTAKSSVWANQLMLMQTEIIQKINAFVGEFCVKEIRFCRDGGRETPEETANPEPDMGRELKKVILTSEEKQQAASLCSQAKDQKLRFHLQRLYEKQLRRQKLEKEHDWHPCKGCSVLCPPDCEYCPACERRLRQEKEEKIRSILMEIPWARYSEIHQYVDCPPEMVNVQRAHLLQRLAANVPQGDKESLKAKSLVMLYRSIPPEQLTEEKLQRSLYALRGDLCYNAEGFKAMRRYDALRYKPRSKKTDQE